METCVPMLSLFSRCWAKERVEMAAREFTQTEFVTSFYSFDSSIVEVIKKG